MKNFCICMVCLGALLMAYNIYAYFKILRFMQEQNYDRNVFRQWMYSVSFLLMIFFLFGYAVVGGSFAVMPYQPYYVMVSAIFLFGALFVLCMVRAQRLMAMTIMDKTRQTIKAMVQAMEAKDIYTKGHSEHVRNLALLIYRHLPDELKRRVSPVKLSDAAMLHDIGKIGIPDQILNKPGKLTPEEFEVIKTHPRNGAAILGDTSYRDISDWILYHHEQMDGKGYYRLPAEKIPIEARIITVADVFSALHTDRVYRERFTYRESVAILKEESGTRLDPMLVDLFCSIGEEEVGMAGFPDM